MASTTKQHEEAGRTVPTGFSPAHGFKPAARGRGQFMLGALAVAITLTAVAAAISNGALPRRRTTGQTARRDSIDASVSRLLAGIPENGAALGSPRAPVTMTFYGDLQCSLCAAFTLYGGLAQLISRQVRSGRVRVIYSPFQTATRSAATFALQQAAALAAGRQHRLWYYVELFYHEQGRQGSGYVTSAYLDGLARQVPGLRYARWSAQRIEPSLLAQVAAAARAGRVKGIQGTPTLIFRGPGGRQAQPSDTIPDYHQLMQAVRQVR
jgi:protein-disulfide isomerase